MVPMGVCVYLVLAPAGGRGETASVAWMTGLSMCVRLMLTHVSKPRSSLAPEIT